MEEALLIARLTLFVLRGMAPAQVVGRDIGFVLMPDSLVLSENQLITYLAETAKPVKARAESRGELIVIWLEDVSAEDRDDMQEWSNDIAQSLEEFSLVKPSHHLIRVNTIHGSLDVERGILLGWSRDVLIEDCVMGFGRPTQVSDSILAVLSAYRD